MKAEVCTAIVLVRFTGNRCVNVLEEEYSVDPEPKTRSLHERIYAGEDIQDYCED
jgi:hypothetical protein